MNILKEKRLKVENKEITLKDSALHYGELGFFIFPLGLNSKYPLKGSRGFKDASNDLEVIEQWWTDNPKSNIGCATEASGLTVLDVDLANKETKPTENQWLKSIDDDMLMDIGSGLQMTTRSGGAQYLFRTPEGKSWKSSAGQFAENVDIRCRGGYVVLPPSLVGGQYKWEGGFFLPDDGPSDLVEPPMWMQTRLDDIENGNEKKETGGVPTDHKGAVIEGGRNNFLASLAGQLRTMGLGSSEIEATLQETNRTRCSPPLGEREVAMVARSVSRYEPDSIRSEVMQNDIDLSCILGKAKEESEGSRIEESEDEDSGEKPDLLSSELYDLPNEGGELIDLIMASAPCPNRELAFGAAVVAFSGMFERKWAGPLDCRTNLEMICLANSGVGKDHPRKVVKQLYDAIGLGDKLAGSLSTKEGLEDFLFDNPACISLSDEADGMLESLKRDRGDQALKLWNFRLELYSSSNSTISGRMKAGHSKGSLHNPFFSVLGSAIPSMFYGALTTAAVAKGLLSRSIIIEAGKRKRQMVPKKVVFKGGFLKRCRSWVDLKVGGNLQDSGVGMATQNKLSFSECGQEAWERLITESDGLYSEGEKENSIAKTCLWNRAGENSLKLAMIGSLLKHGCDCSEIDGDAVEWAKKIVWSSIENMLYRIGQEMTENQDDEMMKKIVSKIRDGGKEFLTRKELFRKMKLKARVLDEYLDSMVENGMIHTAIKKNQTNQAVKIYTV
jgi:hypothetical protein